MSYNAFYFICYKLYSIVINIYIYIYINIQLLINHPCDDVLGDDGQQNLNRRKLLVTMFSTLPADATTTFSGAPNG